MQIFIYTSDLVIYMWMHLKNFLKNRAEAAS